MTTCPKISIVTPSYNQGSFLETTLKSVQEPAYPNLEHIVMDGGSADGSVEIIEKYADHLAYWQSEKDGGQYDAIQKGFDRSTGEIMGWLNSDDMYFPWTLKLVGAIFAQFPEVEWISTLQPAVWSKDGIPYHISSRSGYNARFFLKGLYYSDGRYPRRWFIQQESTFWRRSLWEKSGAKLSSEDGVAGDFELWSRFFQCSDLVGVHAPLGGFRVHGAQRSVLEQQEYLQECEQVLARMGGQNETGISAWLRRNGWGRRWPLRVMPSLGFVQPVQNIHWLPDEERWELRSEWVYE